MPQWIVDLFARYGYATVFFGVFLENTGLPVPGEWYITSVTVISADGKTIGGQAINLNRVAYASWIATVP